MGHSQFLEEVRIRRLEDVLQGEHLQEELARRKKKRRTLSCWNVESILISRKTRLQEARFWKTLGIFLRATLLPLRGSVTDLQLSLVSSSLSQSRRDAPRQTSRTPRETQKPARIPDDAEGPVADGTVRLRLRRRGRRRRLVEGLRRGENRIG